VEIVSAVVSVTRTQRRRYFWAAWWTGAPSVSPFRKPDAANGGARSEAEALSEAEHVAARHLTLVDPYWARAFTRVMRGESAPPRKAPRTQSALRDVDRLVAAHAVLGVDPGATSAQIRTAYKRRALATHPDQGGSDEAFREVQRAYEVLNARLARRVRRT
jgi:DnaJ-domain-containing protein 1